MQDGDSLGRTPARPMPGFRPLSRQPSAIASRERVAEPESRNELDALPLAELIRKHFNMKPPRPDPDRDRSDEDDEIIGDTNFDATGVSADYLNPLTAFDDDQMRADGFENTNEYLKAEFNEPPPRRFGSKEKTPTPRWREDETDLFYRVLSMCGTDFSMMSKFFPKRTRKMIVNKFHCEDTKNKARVQNALNHPQPLDLDLFAATVGIDPDSIVEQYERNKSKLRAPAQGTPPPPAKRRAERERPAGGEDTDEVEWEDVASDKDDGNRDGSDGKGDEIDGDLDF